MKTMRVLMVACLVAASNAAVIDCFTKKESDGSLLSKTCLDTEVCVRTTTIEEAIADGAKTTTVTGTCGAASTDPADTATCTDKAAAAGNTVYEQGNMAGLTVSTCQCNVADCNKPAEAAKAVFVPIKCMVGDDDKMISKDCPENKPICERETTTNWAKDDGAKTMSVTGSCGAIACSGVGCMTGTCTDKLKATGNIVREKGVTAGLTVSTCQCDVADCNKVKAATDDKGTGGSGYQGSGYQGSGYQESSGYQEHPCGVECSEYIFKKVKEADLPTKGFKDTHAAIYGYIIWDDYVTNKNFEVTKMVFDTIGEECKFTDTKWTHADTVKCWDDAKEADITKLKAKPEQVQKYIGALANGLNAASPIAIAFKDYAVKPEILKASIKVYYIFGSVYPNWKAVGTTCQNAIMTAGEYKDGNDIVLAIANHSAAIEAVLRDVTKCAVAAFELDKAVVPYFGIAELTAADSTRRRLADNAKATSMAEAAAAVAKGTLKSTAVQTAAVKGNVLVTATSGAAAMGLAGLVLTALIL